jgi:hypothetical protein
VAIRAGAKSGPELVVAAAGVPVLMRCLKGCRLRPFGAQPLASRTGRHPRC